MVQITNTALTSPPHGGEGKYYWNYINPLAIIDPYFNTLGLTSTGTITIFVYIHSIGAFVFGRSMMTDVSPLP